MADPVVPSVLPAPALSPAVVDLLLDGVVICDADGNVVQANRAVCRLLGLTTDQVTGQRPPPPGWEATLADGRPYSAEDHPTRIAVVTGRPQSELLHIRRPDGTQSWLSVRAMPLPAGLTETLPTPRLVAPGTVDVTRPGAAVASIVDVSHQMDQQQLLLESEQRFRLTLANAPIGIALVAPDGQFLQVNAELERLLGRTGEELAGLRFHDVTHPDDLAADVALVEALLRDEIPKFQLEKRYLHSDGSSVWGRLTVTLIRAADGAPCYFVSQIEDISEVRTAHAQLERRALYDPLTGLANRTLLLDRLGQAVRQHQDDEQIVAVAYCDLDHFKRVNDSLGHAAGDELLREVASRMSDALRPGDTLARIGGDEFVIVLDSVRSLEEATALLTVVKGSVEWPAAIDGQELTPSFSAGLATSAGGRSAETLLRDADTALCSAKQRGRSHWEVFSTAMRAQALAELSVENALRRGLDEEAFELHYQPVVDLDTRVVIAFEALVRWRHPERGLLLPGEFLEVAEDAHLMVPLGRLVIREVCAFLARHPGAPWRVFVNVSPQQIGAADLAGVLATELAAAGVPARRLAVEITENGVLDAFGVSLRDMQRVSEQGVDLVMDDFGTGYSALSSLLAAPIAGVKLDRSFTARLGDGAGGDRITATVGNLVAGLGAYGVVEGVETEDQRQRAYDHGWRLGQGYLFGRPQPEPRLGGVLRTLRA